MASYENQIEVKDDGDNVFSDTKVRSVWLNASCDFVLCKGPDSRYHHRSASAYKVRCVGGG